MKKKTRDWRPTDGYEPACSNNMFLDLKSGDNDREEYLSDKVREYLQSLGMLSETKLPDLFYKGLERAILGSSFWKENNNFDDSDFETYQGENAIQTEAARVLNLSLQDYLKELDIPIIVVIESVDPSANRLAIIGPDHKYYPDRVILGGEQTLSSKNQIVVLLHLATFTEDYNPSDVNPSAISRTVARVIRHEVIHGMQLDKRKANQKTTRQLAKKSYEKEGQIPKKGAARTKYLGSHIEIDAYAHEIAEELYDLLGYEEAVRALVDKNKIKSLEISDQAKEYLYDHAGSKFTKKLVGKAYKHLNDFKDRSVMETKILRRLVKESLSSYDVEDVYSTAQLAHLGQKRRSGEDYFTHPKAVANIVRKYYPKDTRAYLVALLHDTIEDTESVGNLSIKELTSMIGASIGDPAEAKDILAAVNALTHAKHQPYTEYVQSLSSNPMALKVKLADMMHNLSSSPSERQKIKYKNAISSLANQHSGNIPGISPAHTDSLLKLTEVRTVTEFISSNHTIFERSYVTDVLGIKLPLNESYPYSPSLQKRIIQEQLLMEGFFSDLLQKGKDKLLDAAEGIKKFGKEAWSILQGFYLAVKDGAAKQLSGSIAKKAINKFLKPLYGALKWLSSKLPSWNMPTFAKMAEKGIELLDKMKDKLNSIEGWKSVAMYSGVAVGLQWLWNKIGDWVDELKDKVGGDFKAAMSLGEQDGNSEDSSKIEEIKEWLKDTAKEALSGLIGGEFTKKIAALAAETTIAGWWSAAKKASEGAQLVIDALGAATERFVSRHNVSVKAEGMTTEEDTLRRLIRKTLTESVEFHEVDSPLHYNRAGNVKRLALCETSVDARHLRPDGEPQRDTYFNDEQEWERYGRSGRRLKKPRKAGIIPGVSDACVIGFLDYHKEYEKSDGGTSWYIDYMKTRGDKGGTGTASKLVDEFFTRVASSGDTVHFGKMMNPKIGHLKDKMAKKYPDMTVMGAVNY